MCFLWYCVSCFSGITSFSCGNQSCDCEGVANYCAKKFARSGPELLQNLPCAFRTIMAHDGGGSQSTVWHKLVMNITPWESFLCKEWGIWSVLTGIKIHKIRKRGFPAQRSPPSPLSQQRAVWVWKSPFFLWCPWGNGRACVKMEPFVLLAFFSLIL